MQINYRVELIFIIDCLLMIHCSLNYQLPHSPGDKSYTNLLIINLQLVLNQNLKQKKTQKAFVYSAKKLQFANWVENRFCRYKEVIERSILVGVLSYFPWFLWFLWQGSCG